MGHCAPFTHLPLLKNVQIVSPFWVRVSSLKASPSSRLLRCSRFWLRVLDLRRDLDLGRDERPATFVATDALWMPVHKKALWLRWYITASDKLLSLF